MSGFTDASHPRRVPAGFALGRPWRLLAIGVLSLLLSGCPARADVNKPPVGQGRYIVYLDSATAARFADTAARDALLHDWQSRLGATITVERPLATGGWVLVLTPGPSAPDASGTPGQQALLEGLEGVTSVEADALMRRF
jgi:hypothetical protein